MEPAFLSFRVAWNGSRYNDDDDDDDDGGDDDDDDCNDNRNGEDD